MKLRGVDVEVKVRFVEYGFRYQCEVTGFISFGLRV
jgi:hypothetical protein